MSGYGVTQRQARKLLLVGLDNSGKTTITNKMRPQAQDEITAPTIGVNTEDIKIKNVDIKVFDLAGQENFRNVWKHYYTIIDGIIFVIDSSKPDRFGEVKDELLKMLANEDAHTVPCLIFANK